MVLLHVSMLTTDITRMVLLHVSMPTFDVTRMVLIHVSMPTFDVTRMVLIHTKPTKTSKNTGANSNAPEGFLQAISF
jgi:hypothetical protein